MRGEVSKQGTMFSFVSTEERVPESHPLRVIKQTADSILGRMSGFFDGVYDERGRYSIPPETLLKSLILQSLYSIRSERLLCEMLEYNLLFRWFLDMGVDGRVFDHSTLSANRSRLMEHEVAREFFNEVVIYARENKLLSDERFTVDGTQIEAWASLKSFKPKEKQEDDGDDFHGQKRLNETHQSSTDPEARLFRKGYGKESKMSYCGHILTDSKNNLIVGASLTQAGTKCEWEAATKMLEEHEEEFGVRPKYLAADKGYHQQEFINDLREMEIIPHVAEQSKRKLKGLDGRTTRTKSYRRSQYARKFVEHPFGWLKTIGIMRKPKFRGFKRMELHVKLHASIFNLLRISHLTSA